VKASPARCSTWSPTASRCSPRSASSLWSATPTAKPPTCPAGPGLGRKSPIFASVFTFILLAFAGIPLTSGFTAKFAVFGAAIGGGQTWLVIVGVITSMLLAFPYLAVVVLMWLSEPGESTPTVSIPGALTSAALVIGVIVTLALGVIPAPLLDLTNDAASSCDSRS
jgi:NADH-quinone oxidoreductase subunit N